MGKPLTNFTLSLLLVFFFIQSVFAGDTGKITGTVIEKETGDPLPGANVILLETIMGTAVDENGYFLILNVPSGTYTVSAGIIGYSTLTITKVRVSGDLTTNLEFVLSPTVVEGEEIVVEAERKLIQTDMTDSRRTITSDDLRNMAVTSIEDAVAYTAGGVEDAGGNLHFRGGRSAETVYLFEGIQLNDPLTGNPNDSDIPIMAVGETNIITGGFGAEYGNAQSGVINVTGREGRNTFDGDIRYFTSNGVSETVNGANP
ncbi:uncharacterized protein METZ01_LOCUS422442, partial [marine metagenome]